MSTVSFKILVAGLSDTHLFGLHADAARIAASPRKGAAPTDNPEGQPHSAMIAQETMALVVYAGEPDRIDSLEVVDVG